MMQGYPLMSFSCVLQASEFLCCGLLTVWGSIQGNPPHALHTYFLALPPKRVGDLVTLKDIRELSQ